ncbi:transcriptional regulator, HTH domain [Renibacterium salmoninarum ATCC 33209]|uniref:Transcriptional regulator, HTH domain n=1 Tax=Renibacterium salmoninarum (strain ATCC 33209 / DSM 20767 / JCM 11484 / NBRC 15589 / NCIMB 2235) TaxID=288705 RepID=A9WNY8_RENSM|nr:WYL domain-containing protein [Renibacterium salmoninarum]ABY23280.1 transcriptional regulator, HTH domain [Renibacterium salmoninarum ATCC 33209]
MNPESSPTARALQALEILRSRPGTTAEELGTRLGVTDRAARRYVAILREAGIPVESIRGAHGGYRLGHGVRLSPVSFTETESLRLVMAVLGGKTTSQSSEDLLDSALSKVIRVLPDAVAQQARTIREYAATVPDSHLSPPEPSVASTLVTAIAGKVSVLLNYRNAGGKESTVEVDPWAVIVRFHYWYLLGYSHQAAAIRTYRLDRIGGVRPTNASFQPPEDLDPVASLEENLGQGWKFQTRVIFNEPFASVKPWISPTMGTLTALGEGCVLVGSTSNPAMYVRERLAVLPFSFRIEDSPELLAEVSALAQRFNQALAASI